jgi:carbonic anhydrase
MCGNPEQLGNIPLTTDNTVHSGALSRRQALGFIAASALGSLASAPAWAKSAPPKPQNQLTPDQALERLMQGNARYVGGKTLDRNFSATRAALAGGQNPYACLLACADSRVSPELCFDESRGDLFVTRVAGNYVTTDILGSLEYAVAVLKTPLIMVLGHTRCGAVDAAVSAVQKNTSFPGHIQTLTTAVAPAVQAALKVSGQSGTLLDRAIVENVRQNVQRLSQATPILSKQVQAGALKVVGGVYHLDTGRVERV